MVDELGQDGIGFQLVHSSSFTLFPLCKMGPFDGEDI